jgi:lytic cellulose monooxygenase (C1-hydroxylating)
MLIICSVSSDLPLSTITVYQTETEYETDTDTVVVTITDSSGDNSSTTDADTGTPTPPPDDGPKVSKYGQCGGSNYNGPTVCGDGSSCSTINPYYYQCM